MSVLIDGKNPHPFQYGCVLIPHFAKRKFTGSS